MSISLILPSGERKTSTADTISIGSAPSCQICISDPGVRLKHAIIRKVAGKWMIEAEEGILLKVGDEEPARKSWLSEDCTIRLANEGPTVTFTTRQVGSIPGPMTIKTSIAPAPVSSTPLVVVSTLQRANGSAEAEGASRSTWAPRATDGDDTSRTPSTSQIFSAIKTLASSPVGGLNSAYRQLGAQQAFYVGLSFAAVFAVAEFLFARWTLPKIPPVLVPYWTPVLVPYWIRMDTDVPRLSFMCLLNAGIWMVSVAAGSAIARKLLKGAGSVQGDVFLAGSSLLPIAFWLLCFFVLGVDNGKTIGYVGIFAVSTTILVLYSGCTNISEIPERTATLAVPAVIIVSAWMANTS